MSDEQPRTGLSRRAFLRGSGLAAAATAVAGTPLLPPAAEAAQPPPPNVPAQGPGPVKISLNVNGRDMTTSVEPRVTLLDALRNYLDVTGCKRVCDRGTCGACTVMLDGKPVYSCTMLALEAQGKPIRTAESLVAGGKLDAVPAAFVQLRRPAVRLLHAGLRRGHEGGPRQEPQGDAGRGRRGAVRQHLPLRHLRTDAGRHPRPVQPEEEAKPCTWPTERRLIGTTCAAPRWTRQGHRRAPSTASTSTAPACCTP